MRENSFPKEQGWLTKIFRPNRLHTRLMNLLVLFSLLTFLFSSSSVVYFVNRTEVATWQSRQTEVAKSASQTIFSFLEHTEDTLFFLGQIDPLYLQSDPKIMQDLLTSNLELQEIIRLDADGVVLVSAYQDQPLLANLFTIPFSQWFQQARLGHLYYGSVQISANDEPYLIMAIPAEDGGVVAARLHMAVLWQVVADIRFGETGAAYVVDQIGRIIAHTVPKVVVDGTNIAERDEFAKLQQSNGVWSGEYVNFQAQPVVGVTASVNTANWILVTELSQQEAYATTRSAIVLLGGGMLIFIALLTLLSRSFLQYAVLQPMAKLRQGAERIGNGDFQNRIGLSQKDEIGLVAQAFDNMTTRLQENALALRSQANALAFEVAERRQSEARFRAIVEDQTELICRIRADGVLTFVNDTYCRYFNKTHEELLEHSFSPFIPEQDQAILSMHQNSLSPDNSTISVEHRVILTDEKIRWLQWTNRAIFDNIGNLIEIQAVGRDITERKQAEEEIKRLNIDLERRVAQRTEQLALANEELQREVAERRQAELTLFESQKRLQLALRAAKAGAWEWNILSNQAVWSEENFLIMGLDPQQAGASFGSWLQNVHPEDQQVAMAASMQAVELQDDLNIEFRVVWPDGSVHWLNDIGQLTFDETGKPVSMYGIQMDITERKHIESEVKASLGEKEVLLKEIHHRVKNNLQVIASMLNLQSGNIEDPRTLEIFQASQNRVAAMATIHEKLYQTKNLSRIDFADYIRDLAEQLLNTYERTRHRVRLSVEADPILLGVNVAIPCGLILSELVSNALKHAFPCEQEDSQITIRFQRKPSGNLSLMVADNGIGFPPHLDFRNTTSLGLQLVVTLVRQVAGDLQMKNEQGTCFQIDIPNNEGGI